MSEKRLKPEQRLSVAVANMIRADLLAGDLRCCCTHIKNEHEASGHLAALQVEIAKAMGVIPGAPDWLFGAENFCGLIEMKIAKNGRLSDRQKDFRQWCGDVGVPYVVCHTVEEVRDTLIDWNLLKPSMTDVLRRVRANPTTPSVPQHTTAPDTP